MTKKSAKVPLLKYMRPPHPPLTPGPFPRRQGKGRKLLATTIFAFLIACGGNPTAQNAFFEVAGYYDGSEKMAVKALGALQAAEANADNLNIVAQICADHSAATNVVGACNETFGKIAARTPDDDAKSQVVLVRNALALHESLMREQGALCTGDLKASAHSESEKKGTMSYFYKGVAALCDGAALPQNTLRHAGLVEYLEGGRSEWAQILRGASEALLFWSGSPAAARLYYRGARLLAAYKLRELNQLLEPSPSGPAKTLLAAEASLTKNLIEPHSKTAKKNVPGEELEALAEKNSDCKSDLCRFLAARAQQLLGETAFQRRRYTEAINAFAACRNLSGSPQCLEQSAVARLAAGKKIPEDDIVLLKNRAGRGFVSNFLGHNSGESGAFELRDRFLQGAKKLPNHKMQKVVTRLVKDIKTHPYLRGRAPFEIEVYITESKDAVAHFVRGTGYIFIGDKFLQMLEKATDGSEFSTEDVLAVTLGHEIHHLVAGHGVDSCNVLSHADNFSFGRAGTNNLLVKAAQQHESWRREFEADENGMLYAFLTGKKAGAFLATLYVVGREEKSGGSATHPATVERIRVLREKMQVLSVAAAAFNRANESLREMDKMVRAGKTPSDADLSATERDLVAFSEIVPGYPAAHVNLSYVALRRVLNLIKSPEMPTMAMMNTEMNLVVPSAPTTSAAGGKGCLLREKICAVKTWRPAMGKAWSKTTIALVKSAQAALERGVSTFPDDHRLQNNLALTWYYLAEAEIAGTPDLGCITFSPAKKKRLNTYLDRAERHLEKAQATSPEAVQDMAHNRAAIHIARYHVDGRAEHLTQARQVFLIPGKEKEMALRPGMRFNDALAFAVGYARALQFYQQLSGQEGQGEVIDDADRIAFIEKDVIRPTSEFLGNLTVRRPSTHWQKELVAIKAAVDSEFPCKSTPEEKKNSTGEKP